MKLNTIDIVGKIADMKMTDYNNTLAVATLIELLIDKGLITRQEFTAKSTVLDNRAVSGN